MVTDAGGDCFSLEFENTEDLHAQAEQLPHPEKVTEFTPVLRVISALSDREPGDDGSQVH